MTILCLQVAELDAYAGRIRTDADSLQGAATELRSDLNQMEVSQGMLSDSVDSIHYGLLGGFTRHSDLSAGELRPWKFGCSKNYGFSTVLAGCSSIEQGCDWRRRHR